MTENELNQLYYLNIEIKYLRAEIERIENKSEVRAQVLTGMPFSGKLSDPTGEKGTDLSENKMLLNLSLTKAEIEKNRLERFIGNVEDPEMRDILRLRHKELMTWERIGKVLNMERTTVSKKYRRFLKENHISHNSH